jgi:hypothetical protein
VRRVLATLRPREEPDREAIVLGRDEERLVSVHGDGSSRRWPEGPTPRRHAALADRATPSRPVAAVHGGRDPAEVAVLAGDGSGVSVVHRTASGGGDAEPGAVRSELVWAEDRPYVAWLRPAEDGVALRVLGWRGWDDLRAGDEPHTDGAVVLRGAPEPRSALAPVSWHEHGDGETTLELGRRDDPEGFGEAGRRGVGLRFDDEGALRVPDEAELRRLEP